MCSTRMVAGIVLLLVLCVAGQVSATTYYVDPNGNDANDGSSWEEAFATIQHGIDTAGDGNVVEVNEGTYYESIDFNGIACTVRSTNSWDWDVVAATVIDGNGAGNTVTFNSNEDANSVLVGLTVTGAGSSGIHCSASSPTISNCIVTENTYLGINSNSGASPTIENNIIRDHSYYGICSYAASEVVRNSIICDCDKGIYMYGTGGARTITNCTIVNNTTDGIKKAGNGTATISNCIVWNNNDDLDDCSATYSCIEDCNDANGTGNICGDANDPCFVDADNNDFHIDVNESPCVDSGDPNGDYSGLYDIDGDTRLMWTAVDIGADEMEAYILFGMEIVSTTEDDPNVIVQTTGAAYVLGPNGIDLYRRIDPNTNDYDTANGGKGRKVAELKFASSLGSLTVESADEGKAVIESDDAKFTFYSDSFFIMEANDTIDCNYTSLISAEWNAPLEADDREMDRMWTDGYGGSLHALLEGSPTLNVNDVNTTCFTMSDGNKMGFMAFPPKKYDFEGLYGQDAKPFMKLLSTEYQLLEHFSYPNILASSIADGLGIYLLWNSYYSETDGNTWTPEVLGNGLLGYEFNDVYKEGVREFIQLAHEKGAKVIPYLFDPDSTVWNYPDGNHQSYIVTAQWMQDFQREYGFDGWYIDSSDNGGLWDDYDFMRMVRTSVGEEGIIYHHDSPDVWDGHGYRGLRAINVNTYVNQTLDGETTGWYWGRPPIAKEDQPNDPYFRYFVCGYGTSQAYGVYIWEMYGHRVITLREICRMMGENLNGSSWTCGLTTLFRPFYEKRKAEYLNDANVPFEPDVNWPIDSSSGWFRNAGDVNVTSAIDSCDIVIEWTTYSNADSNVFYTSNGKWWSPVNTDTPVNPAVGSSEKVTSHSVSLSGLEPSTTYEFRIKSSNGEPNEDEIIWSHVGTFTTKFPAHWWPFDEGSGTDANDLIDGNDGTLENGAGWTSSGVSDDAVSLDGTNDFVSVSDLDGEYDSGDTFSVAGWFKTEQGTGIQTIVGQWAQYNPQGYPPNLYWGWQVLVENDKVVARFSGGGTTVSDITGTTDVNDPNWHHFALVYPTSSSNTVLYVDGESEGTPAARSISPNNTRFRIGDGSYELPDGESCTKKGGPFNGDIDDVMLFERALSDEEVEQLWNAGQ